MHFDVDALPAADYAKWIADAKSAGETLDREHYAELVKPSENVKPVTYRAFEPGLFNAIVNGTAPAQAPAAAYEAGAVGVGVTPQGER